jgi:hypothetical protein
MSVQRLVHQLGEIPAGVFAADWTIIGWNKMWTAAVGDPGAYGWDERNLVSGMFQANDRRGRDPIAAWPVWSWKGNEAQEEDLVADLRVTAAAYPDDVRLASFIEHMLGSNPRFARLWFNGNARTFVSDHETIEHPLVGDITLDLDVLMAAGSDLRIVTFAAAAETTDAEKMDALRAACHLPRKSLARPNSEISGLG